MTLNKYFPPKHVTNWSIFPVIFKIFKFSCSAECKPHRKYVGWAEEETSVELGIWRIWRNSVWRNGLTFTNLILHYRRRLQAVILAKGGWTKCQMKGCQYLWHTYFWEKYLCHDKDWMFLSITLLQLKVRFLRLFWLNCRLLSFCSFSLKGTNNSGGNCMFFNVGVLVKLF